MSVNIVDEPHKVKIRKNHICQGYGKLIKIGEEAIIGTYSDSGEIWSIYECEECSDYSKNKCSHCKDFDMCMGLDYYVGLIRDCKENN